MKLGRLLQEHRKFENQGLAGSFGDGYLFANNRIYATVRKAALNFGYQFSFDRNEAYETFPLLQLNQILESKSLPYSKNASAFADLTESQLSLLTWDDVDGNLKKNFVFHEGSHALAREIVERELPKIAKPHDLESQREFALRMLIEESCANTCELLAVTDVQDPIHRIFFEINSYMNNFENRSNLKKALEEIGDEVVFKFMFLAYLHANFLRERIEDRGFQRMINLCGRTLSPQEAKSLRALGKIAFQLSERFRVQTTGFHLRLAGIRTEIYQLFDFDFLKCLENDAHRGFLSHWASFFASDA